jgi:hypothetical protein
MLTAKKNKDGIEINAFHHLSDETEREVLHFLEEFDIISFQQFPQLTELQQGQTIFFISKRPNRITGFALVIIKKFLLATLTHGPVGNDCQEMMIAILKYLKKKRVSLFRWMPPQMENKQLVEIEKALSRYGNIIRDANNINWATIQLSLAVQNDALLKSFSKNHKRSIRKAIQAELLVDEIKDEETIKKFSEGYVKMYQHRKIKIDTAFVFRQFTRLFRFFSATRQGFFLTAKKGERLLGGVCVIYAGKNAVYYKGYIDHDYKKLPIHHLVFYKAMLKAKSEGKSIFDLGGYALEPIDRQLRNINRFKDGFKGSLIKFPLTKLVSLTFLGQYLYKIKKKLHR